MNSWGMEWWSHLEDTFDRSSVIVPLSPIVGVAIISTWEVSTRVADASGRVPAAVWSPVEVANSTYSAPTLVYLVCILFGSLVKLTRIRSNGAEGIFPVIGQVQTVTTATKLIEPTCTSKITKSLQLVIQFLYDLWFEAATYNAWHKYSPPAVRFSIAPLDAFTFRSWELVVY